MKCIKAWAVIIILGIAAGMGLMYSGVINVAATNPHNALTAWVLGTASDRSIHYHARGIQVPALDSHEMILAGFRHYREMCVGCHLAPGIRTSEISQGLMPRPPKLQEAAGEWTPAELFWVIKNGIKMTGMPAWGPTHSDEKLWQIVAFVKQLPKMTPARYQALAAEAGPATDEDEDHVH